MVGFYIYKRLFHELTLDNEISSLRDSHRNLKGVLEERKIDKIVIERRYLYYGGVPPTIRFIASLSGIIYPSSSYCRSRPLFVIWAQFILF
jgi:hypothetical protein